MRIGDIWFAKNSSILTVVYLSACPQYTSLILACLHFALELSYRYQEDVDSTYMHFIYYKSSFNYLPFSRHISLYLTNTINYVCFRHQYYKCIYYNTISKTKAIVLFKRTLELGLAKLDKYLLNSVYSFWAKLHEVIQLHTLQCIISLILTQRPCEWFTIINPHYPNHTRSTNVKFRGNDK